MGRGHCFGAVLTSVSAWVKAFFYQLHADFWFNLLLFLLVCLSFASTGNKFCTLLCLLCFATVGWALGRASGLEKKSNGVLMWLCVWSKVQIVCIWSSWLHCIPKPHRPLPHLNPDWFYFSGTGLPRLSWKKKAVKWCSRSSSSSVSEIILSRI